MESKVMTFNSLVQDYTVVNPEFAKVKVYVCYAGKNRNYSDIPQDVLDKMSKTIYGIPMVAEYDKENNCFKGHGGKLEISDDGIDFIQTTVPYGFIDPTTPVFYEDVTELDGMTTHRYLCCYAYLWYKRYPEVEKVLKDQDNKPIGQSMEVVVNDYEFTDDGYYKYKDAYFSALCMLGVEPCFESAKVTSHFEKTNENFIEMMNAFKKYTLENISNQEGDNLPEDNNFEKEETVKEEEPKINEFKEKEVEVKEEPEIEENNEEQEEQVNYVAQIEELNKKVSGLQAELDNAKANYTDLQMAKNQLDEELTDLRKFKSDIETAQKKAETDNVLEQFSMLKNIEGYEDLIKDAYEISKNDLVIKLKVFAYDHRNEIKENKQTFANKNTDAKLVTERENNGYHGDWSILDKYKK